MNRSSFLWALWKSDDTVRLAFEQSGLQLDDFAGLLGISGDPEPLAGSFEIGEGLARALRTFAATRGEASVAVTPAELGVAVLQDVQGQTGPLAVELRQLGADAGTVLAALLKDRGDDASGGPLVAVRDLSARRFGVQLPAGAGEPGPYFARDLDAELDRLLEGRQSVVAVVAPALSGAIRSIFEAIIRMRPDDRVLLMSELVEEGRAKVGAADLDQLWSTSGAGVVWVRDLRELVGSSPAFGQWFSRRRADLQATLVVRIRPDELSLAQEFGLLSGGVVELGGSLTLAEQARARRVYGRDLSTVSELASAAPVDKRGVRANYAADSAAASGLLDERSDDLDIRADTDMLAKLIASKDARPPLSIGLFGPWGSGKSFLMRQVQLRIADLADRSRGLPAESTGYLSEIVSVDFNAWQYARGGALWASLINRVFEGIQEKLGGDDRYQRVLRDIASKNTEVEKAHQKVEDARAKVEKKESAAGDRAIEDVVSPEATAEVIKTLDLEATKKQVSDVRNAVGSLVTITSRLRRGWSTASTARRTVVLGAAIIGLVLLGLVTFVPSFLQPAAALLATAGSIMTALTQVLKPVNHGLEQAANLLRADDEDKQQLQQAQDELEKATRRLATAEASGLAGLYGFVSDRSMAAEYRRHLGMAPMIRDDLKRLADLSQQGDGLPGIERIVIFIDDLDRCPASEVVRVLEAVNLLFGFELFVVVVAVDSRWLLRSLKKTFSEAFEAQEETAPTPQNYLEKIIQIPFWLRQMQPEGFERLVLTLAGEVDDGPIRTDRRIGQQSSVAPPSNDAPVDAGGEGASREVNGVRPATAVPKGTVATGRGREDLNPNAVRLTKDERDFMRKFLPLVGTPRAVKRFMNTYQLLRVSVDDVDAFLGRSEYQPVLILLALMTGTAPLTGQMIDELRSMPEANFKDFLEAGKGQPPHRDRSKTGSWPRVVVACSALPTATLTPAVIAEWLPKVARYSFHPVEG